MTDQYDQLHMMTNNPTKFEQNPSRGFWGVVFTSKMWKTDEWTNMCSSAYMAGDNIINVQRMKTKLMRMNKITLDIYI